MSPEQKNIKLDPEDKKSVLTRNALTIAKLKAKTRAKEEERVFLDSLRFKVNLILYSKKKCKMDHKSKMLSISMMLIDKLINNQTYEFDNIISRIIQVVPEDELEALLPFIKQTYAAYWVTASEEVLNKMTLNRARKFNLNDLKEIAIELNNQLEHTEPKSTINLRGKRVVKVTILIYFWFLTIFTVFFFPFQFIDSDMKEPKIEHHFIGKANPYIHVDSNKLSYIPEKPAYLNYAGKTILLTALFVTVLILFKPKK